MASNPLLKRLLDAGMHFTEMSQTTAEKLVGEFVKAGGVRRKDAERTVQHLVDRGRTATEHLVSTVQSEVTTQLGRFAGRLDDVERRLEDIASKLGVGGRSAAPPDQPAAASPPAAAAPAAASPVAPAKSASAKKSSAKKSPAKKSAATKAAAKKSAPKTTTKQAAGKQPAAAKKPVPSSGIGKVSVGRAPAPRAAQP